MNVNRIICFLVGSGLWMMSGIASAKFYKCIKNGVEVFSDRACGADHKKLKLKGYAASSSSETAFERQKKYLEALSDEKTFKNKEKAKQDEEKKIFAENCKKARANLKIYKSRGRLYEDLDGKRNFLDAKQKQAGLTKTEQQIKKWCYWKK